MTLQAGTHCVARGDKGSKFIDVVLVESLYHSHKLRKVAVAVRNPGNYLPLADEVLIYSGQYFAMEKSSEIVGRQCSEGYSLVACLWFELNITEMDLFRPAQLSAEIIEDIKVKRAFFQAGFSPTLTSEQERWRSGVIADVRSVLGKNIDY